MTGSPPVLAAAAEADAAACAGSRLCAQTAEGIRGPVPLPGSPTGAGSGPR
ncbi:hypothetical protein QOZ88_05355 [Blastococcus sp. BMG 814]|uniref:Uncharacterized protein n=1 Tax=Blastococcus carthaginiensis TaxID=3050034 RepID=A0ABT9I903_9ACTN|nr:hypothetical protein [Blastococcus carthaginiensis]MDP5182057.1 hypothetical protein [Blastococcus carthaginiensis]